MKYLAWEAPFEYSRWHISWATAKKVKARNIERWILYSQQMPGNKDYISISFNVQKISEISEMIAYKLNYLWMIWDGIDLCPLTLSVLLKLPMIKSETWSVLACFFILSSNSISLNLPSDLSGNTAVIIGLVLLIIVCIFWVGCWKIYVTLLVSSLLLLMNL